MKGENENGERQHTRRSPQNEAVCERQNVRGGRRQEEWGGEEDKDESKNTEEGKEGEDGKHEMDGGGDRETEAELCMGSLQRNVNMISE